MTRPIPALITVGAAVIAIVVGVSFLRPSQQGVGNPQATGTPSPTPVEVTVPPGATPAVSPALAMTVPFTSERYGYRLAYPEGWTPTPASRAWDLDTDRLDFASPGADRFIDEGASYQILFTVFAERLQDGMSPDDWIAAYQAPNPDPAKSCPASVEDPTPVDVDGHTAVLWTEPETGACGATYTFVTVEDRIFMFAAWRANQEELLKTFLSTVRFDPLPPGRGSPTAGPS